MTENTRRKRILFVIDTLEVGGAEQSLLALTSRLRPDVFDPTVCMVYSGDGLRSQFEEAGIRVIQLEIRKKYGFVSAIRRLRRLIREERPDLIHTSLFRASQVGRVAGWLAGCPVVSSFGSVPYDPVRIQNDPAVRPWKQRILQLIDACTARLAARFHSVSCSVRESNCHYLRIPVQKVTVIPRGRNPDDYARPPAHEIDEARAEFGLAPSGEDRGLLLLNVGRLMSAKGQSTLVDSMKIVRDHLPNSRLVIAGDGPFREQLENQARQLNLEQHITFAGRRSDIPRLLHAADMFVFPSLHEGLPGALLEAALAGRPIVASDIPMNRELVEHGKSALLVPHSDPAALASAILQLAGDDELADRLACRANEASVRQFNLTDVVKRMETMYLDLTDLSSGRAEKSRSLSDIAAL